MCRKPRWSRSLRRLRNSAKTISDIYADLRWKTFVDALEGELDEDDLAREVINVVSPVAKLMVANGSRQAGYHIRHEHEYWAGYERLSKAELNGQRSEHGFSVAGPRGAEIYIEPVTNTSHLNPGFTRIRIENYLNEVFDSIETMSNGEALPLQDVQTLLSAFRTYAGDRSSSLAKLRQFYVISKVEQHWQEGTVKITNNELKHFLESRGRDARNGYQVTSFASEFEKIFANPITATKTRNALSLSWSKVRKRSWSLSIDLTNEQ
jgi:hypothetical protein